AAVHRAIRPLNCDINTSRVINDRRTRASYAASFSALDFTPDGLKKVAPTAPVLQLPETEPQHRRGHRHERDGGLSHAQAVGETFEQQAVDQLDVDPVDEQRRLPEHA